MKRHLITIIISIACFTTASVGQNFSVNEITFKNDSLILFADIFTPNESDKKIGIALIQGSGNSDRTNLWSKDFAELFANNGYYVLQPDKRGCGKSEGNWKDASFAELAQDAIASALTLKEMYNLDKIGVLGLSQGGKIVPVVANNTDIDFIINISGSAVSVEEQIIHEVTNSAIKAGLTPEEVIGVLELHVDMKNYVFEGDWSTLEKKIEAIKKSSWADFGMTFPHKQDVWIWDWVKKNYYFDPIDYWSKVKQDVFIAYGSEDQKDNVPVYESIYLLQKCFKDANKSNYKIGLYDTGHSLRNRVGALSNDFQNDILDWLIQL